MPDCCVETKRRGIALGLIACSAVVMSAKVARAGGRVRALLRSSLAPCGGDLLSRGLEGGHSAQAHAAQAHASASRVATKKSIPTCSLIFIYEDGPEQSLPYTTIHVKIPFSVSMRQPDKFRTASTTIWVLLRGHGICGIDLPAPGEMAGWTKIQMKQPLTHKVRAGETHYRGQTAPRTYPKPRICCCASD